MQKHTKIYFKHYGIVPSEVVLCENCGTVAVDIHHLNGRKCNDIQSLIALCRNCHTSAHNDKNVNKVLIKLKKQEFSNYEIN